MCNCSHQAIAKIENCQTKNPSFETITKIAVGTHISVQELLSIISEESIDYTEYIYGKEKTQTGNFVSIGSSKDYEEASNLRQGRIESDNFWSVFRNDLVEHFMFSDDEVKKAILMILKFTDEEINEILFHTTVQYSDEELKK